MENLINTNEFLDATPFDPADYNEFSDEDDDFSIETEITQFVQDSQLIVKENDKRYKKWMKK